MSATFAARYADLLWGALLGHELGQWSERRWWGQLEDRGVPGEREATKAFLLDARAMDWLIDAPPHITTPGYEPTCFRDTFLPVALLCQEYAKHGARITPEAFRDFLLANKRTFLLHGAGRCALELMQEGMNPRIAGLYAPSVVSGVWVGFPAGLFEPDAPFEAYAEGFQLSTSLNGADTNRMAGSVAALVSCVVVPGCTLETLRATLAALCAQSGDVLLARVLAASRAAGDVAAWRAAMLDEALVACFKAKYNGLEWDSSFYTAVAAFDYALEHELCAVDMAAMLLPVNDTRFGAMIALALYTAYHGEDALPEVWRAHLHAHAHAECVKKAVRAGLEALRARSERYETIAARIEALCAGEDRESVLYSKVFAASVNGAAGNAMGSPVEARDWEWIREHHGFITDFLDLRRVETEDDAAMFIMWGQTYLEKARRVFPQDLAETFLRDMHPKNFYYDSQHAYNLLRAGLPAHACGHWNLVTGSALMGCNPCGFYHAADPEMARNDGRELAYHYQRGMDVEAAGILCAAAAAAFREEATVETILEAALEAAPESIVHFQYEAPVNVRARIRGALAALEGVHDFETLCRVLYAGYLEYDAQEPLEVVIFTLGVFKVCTGDVRNAMAFGTNIGRDSDTIACQAAVLSSLLQGKESIPPELYSRFSEARMRMYDEMALGFVALLRQKARRHRERAALVRGAVR